MGIHSPQQPLKNACENHLRLLYKIKPIRKSEKMYTLLTCVNICPAMIPIFTDWRGIYRVRRSTSPSPAPKPASPDITYETTATATKGAPTARMTATTMPTALFAEHCYKQSSVVPSIHRCKRCNLSETENGQQPGEWEHYCFRGIENFGHIYLWS